MPEMGSTLALLGVTVLVSIFAGFVIFENAGDEREVVHRMNAGRVAYLSGLGVLTVALIVQGLKYEIDPWISLALGVMVVSKLVARKYFQYHQ